MVITKSLKISGYRNELVPNTFFRQQMGTDHLGIMLPGTGYTSHMPLLYYPGKLLLFQGADLLRLEYEYIRRSDFIDLSKEEQFQWALCDAAISFKIGLSQRPYRKITFIGKSLGTRTMGHFLKNEIEYEKAQAVWLTPVFRDEKLREQILNCPQKSLLITGSADPQYDSGYLDRFEHERGKEIMVVDGADHSLEVEGDLFKSLHIIERVMQRIKLFVGM